MDKEQAKKLLTDAEYRKRAEKVYRQKLLTAARGMGFEADLIKLFQRFDDYQKGCKTDDERKMIAIMAIKELNDLFNTHKGWAFKDAFGQEQVLTIDGKVMKDE